MTTETVASTEPERQGPTAADIKPGAWLAQTYDRGAARALDVYPYRDNIGTEWVYLTYLEIGQPGPNSENLHAHDPVLLATAEEIEEIEAEARRRNVAQQLHQLSELILRHELPVPSSVFTGVTVSMRYEDPAIVERIGEAIGLPAKTVGRETSVEWPHSDPFSRTGVVATFYGLAPKTYEARDVDEEQTGEAVPADVEGVSVGAGEARQVSAPPAPTT